MIHTTKIRSQNKFSWPFCATWHSCYFTSPKVWVKTLNEFFIFCSFSKNKMSSNLLICLGQAKTVVMWGCMNKFFERCFDFGSSSYSLWFHINIDIFISHEADDFLGSQTLSYCWEKKLIGVWHSSRITEEIRSFLWILIFISNTSVKKWWRRKVGKLKQVGLIQLCLPGTKHI